MNKQSEFKRGIYETAWGNAAYVGGKTAKSAWDIDAGERIPIEFVSHTRLRDADPDEPGCYRLYQE